MVTFPSILGVFTNKRHTFSKAARESITLLEGLGIEGDAHLGSTVQHRWDAKRDPTRPNRRQVHLIQSELLDELNGSGFDVKPGELGENISTRDLDLLALPTGARLHLGADAIVEVTGLRHPCVYIEKFQTGLLAAVLEKRPGGEIVRKTGVMSVVVRSGQVRATDRIVVHLPEGPHVPLQPL